MRTQQLILIAASCVYVAVLVVTAYFTRATRRRVTGALIGGVAAGVESLAHVLGWWHYPSVETPYGRR
jgi:Kef-type K+ transport system membrane component KefB